MNKECSDCHIIKKHFAKGLCQKCYSARRAIKLKGDNWNKVCSKCGVIYFSKWCISRAKYCKSCAYIVIVDNHRRRHRIKYGVPLEKPVLNKKRNGEGYICPQGYKWVSRPNHPNSKSKQGRIGEHTIVMSEHLKRPLRKDESVHHKNGVRTDNRIENLELWSRGQPGGQRVIDKIEFYKEFLESYGYSIIDPAKSLQ